MYDEEEVHIKKVAHCCLYLMLYNYNINFVVCNNGMWTFFSFNEICTMLAKDRVFQVEFL